MRGSRGVDILGPAKVKEYHYARQKFWEAVDALVGDGLMRERLGYARMYLSMLRPEDDLPEEPREDFRVLMHELNL